MIRAAVVDGPLDPARLLAEAGAPGVGALTCFVGTVRDINAGRQVAGIDYAAYDAMATREMDAIAREAAERFGVGTVLVEHRTGTLGVGEASVVIVVAHAHRSPALDAQRYVIEELKRRVPVWKREHYVDGTREWVDPTGRARAESAP